MTTTRGVARGWGSWGGPGVPRPQSTVKVGTHEGACSRSTLLQHAPGAKLPRLHQRFLAKKYVAQQNFCSRVLLPHIKLVWYEGANSRGKSVARVCFRSKLPGVYWNLLAVTWRVSSWPIKLAFFFIHNSLRTHFHSSHAPIGLFYHSAASSCPSCVPVGVLTRERVSGASSLVCTGLKRSQYHAIFPTACPRVMLQKRLNVKARLHRRFFVAAIRCNFCRAQVASSNRMCKRAAISVRFRRDFSPRLECKLMQTTKIAVILISGLATEQDVWCCFFSLIVSFPFLNRSKLPRVYKCWAP